MVNGNLGRVRWLAFDVFGTVMDFAGSLSGPVGEFLRAHGSAMSGGRAGVSPSSRPGWTLVLDSPSSID